jgi:hypothetical protein
MTYNQVTQPLEILRQEVKAVTKHGTFLLSTGIPSRYWVAIGELRYVDAVQSAIARVLGCCLPRFNSLAKIGTVFVPMSMDCNDDDYPIDIVVGNLWRSAVPFLTPLQLVKTQFDHHRLVQAPPFEQQGNWLGIFVLSVHLDMIAQVLDSLIDRGHKVTHFLVMIERENETRDYLSARGVELVPLLVCDNETGEPKTILEKMEPPYARYHRFFADIRSEA